MATDSAEQGFLSFIDFLNNKDKYEKRVKALTDLHTRIKDSQVVSHAKICEANIAVEKAEEIQKSNNLSNIDLTKREDLTEKKEKRLDNKDKKLKEEGRDLKSLKESLDSKEIGLNSEKSVMDKELTELSKLKAAVDRRMKIVSDKEAKLEAYFK